jgi:hypothetical protein
VAGDDWLQPTAFGRVDTPKASAGGGTIPNFIPERLAAAAGKKAKISFFNQALAASRQNALRQFFAPKRADSF